MVADDERNRVSRVVTERDDAGSPSQWGSAFVPSTSKLPGIGFETTADMFACLKSVGGVSFVAVESNEDAATAGDPERLHTTQEIVRHAKMDRMISLCEVRKAASSAYEQASRFSISTLRAHSKRSGPSTT